MDKDTAPDKICLTFTLRQLIAQQNFITYSHRESYGPHKINVNRTIGSNFVCRDRSISKTTGYTTLDCFPPFKFQYLPFSLKSSSSCTRLLRLLVPSPFPSITCFRRQFLHKMWPIQLAFLLLLFVWHSSPPWLSVTLLHSSHDQSNWPLSSITFQNCQYISDLVSEESKAQHHTKLLAKCSISLDSSWNLSPICWWKGSSSRWKPPCKGNPGFRFICTSYIICYQAIKIVEIFHIYSKYIGFITVFKGTKHIQMKMAWW